MSSAIVQALPRAGRSEVDGRPGAAAVAAAQEVGLEVAALVVVEGGVDDVRVEARGEEVADVAHLRDAREGVLAAPGLPRVLAHLHEAVVGPDVEEPLDEGRLLEGDDVAEEGRRGALGHGVGAPDLAHHLQRVAVDLPGEVLADGRPAVAAVLAAEDPLRREVQARRLVGREDERGVPVPAQGVVAGLLVGLDEDGFPASPVETAEDAVLERRVDDVRVGGVDAGVEAVAAPGDEPVVVGDAVGVPRPRGAAQGVVVLGAAVDEVGGRGVVDLHPVELGHGQVRGPLPGGPPVEALVEPAVAAHEVVVGVVGVDPDRVVVHVLVALAEVRPGLARVVRHLQEDVHRVEPLVVPGVDEDLLVVHGAAGDVIAALLPALAAVRGPEGPARLVRGGGLDERVEGVGLGGSEGEADPAHLLLGEPLLDPLPGLAAVGRLVNTRPRAAVDEGEDVAPALVGGGDEGVGVAGVHDDVGHARVLVDREHGRPGLPAVCRLVEAAVAAGSPQRALGRHVDDVRVLRVNEDLADVLGGLEAHVLPALPAVLAPVDAVAVADAPLRVVLARAHPDHVGVPRVDRDAADRVRPLAVEDRRPGRAAVVGPPHAAGGDRQEPPLLVGGVDRDVDDAAGGDGGADTPQGEAAPGVGRPAALGLLVLGLRLGGGRWGLGLLRGLRLRSLLRGLRLRGRFLLLGRRGERRGRDERGDQGCGLLHVQLHGSASSEAPTILSAPPGPCKPPSRLPRAVSREAAPGRGATSPGDGCGRRQWRAEWVAGASD